MEHASEHNPATRVIGGLVFVAAIVGLYFQIAEPFEGRSLAYVGRLLGPVTMLLIGAQLFLQRRHPLFAALVIVLSVLSLLFVVLGFRH